MGGPRKVNARKRTAASTRTPKSRSTYHHGNLRQALLDAAIEIVQESGSDAFTVREAARRCGVDHRSAYRHFADKSALLAALAEDSARVLLDAARRAVSRVAVEDAAGRLRAIARAYAIFAMEHPAEYRVLTGPRVNEGGAFPELDAVLTASFQLLRDEIRGGVEREVFRPLAIDPAVVAFWSTLHGYATLVLMRRIRVRRDQVEAFTDAVFSATIAGFLRPAS